MSNLNGLRFGSSTTESETYWRFPISGVANMHPSEYNSGPKGGGAKSCCFSVDLFWFISNEPLHSFSEGTAVLAPDKLRLLANILFGGNTEYDPAIDRLRSANRNETKPLGIHPPQIDPGTLPTYRAGRRHFTADGQPAEAQRPGWVREV
jgi:hypothetical protein